MEEASMRFNEDGYLQLDKWEDKIFVPGWGGGIDLELRSVFFQAGIRASDMLVDASERFDLNDDDALWIWAHGNKHRDHIAGGADEIFSAGRIAESLSG